MRIGQGVRTGLWHRGITCVLQTQFSGYIYIYIFFCFEKSKVLCQRRDVLRARTATIIYLSALA